MCQIVSTVVKADKRGVPKIIEVKLDTGEVVAYTFPVIKTGVGSSGLFGSTVHLVPLDPLTYDECLFGSASTNGGAS